MQSSGGKPNRLVRDNPSSKARKPYVAPTFTALRPDQAKAELESKGIPGDPAVQKLLGLVPAPDMQSGQPQPASAGEANPQLRADRLRRN